MVVLRSNIFKKIVIILSIFMMLVSFIVSPASNAAVKTQMKEGEFYYAGTATGQYMVSENIFEWLVELIKEIVDFLLGIMTMGGRMVFVGWTALLEKLLTITLEASVGIPMDIENDVSTTSLDGIVSSSNNVTIEAIVYNKVPILNVNLFDNSDSTCVSGTGKFFVVCETCYNKQNPTAAEENENRNIYAPRQTKVIGKNQKICKMDDCTCQECWDILAEGGYLETDSAGNIKLDDEGKPIRKSNAMTVIKDSVSKWYYIIRLIAIAGMLCILLVVGIKMAISTIATDKALYKRMLVDWIVGMIILFAIHYFMVGVIYINNVFVDFISNTETGVSELTKEEYNINDKSNEEMEIGLYQAVRTRAYDPKLINGTTGAVLYITLLFYTFRFVIIYLKRYLTIIILTLIAPGIAFSYALQRVLTGKSAAFSKWMHEYFINVFIQTVHALVYTVFVSLALILSLQSISGIILAFVFMNFMLKADDIFRKLFNLSGDSTEDAMNATTSAKQMLSGAKTAVGFMTAGNILKKSPITKAVKAPLKMARTAAVLGAVNINGAIKSRKNKNTNGSETISGLGENNSKSEAINKNEQLDSIITKLQNMRGKIAPNTTSSKKFAKFLSSYTPKHGVNSDGEDAIEEELQELEKIAQSKNISEEDKNKLEDIKTEFEELNFVRNKFDKATDLSTKDVFKAHINKFLDKDNYYEIDPETGKRKLRYGLFGKKEYDGTKDKWVRRTTSDLISEQLKSENLLGFTDEDKELMKEIKAFAKGTFIGLGSLFLGFGTVISNPAIGMGLLAKGVSSTFNFMDKTGMLDVNKNYRKPTVDEKHKKFTFNRFGKGAKQNIVKSIIENAENEKDKFVVENVRKNHKKLYRTLILGGAGLITVGTIGFGAPAVIGTGVVATTLGRGIRKYSGYSKNSLFGKINKHHFEQFNNLKRELLQDEIRLLSVEEQEKMQNSYDQLILIIDENLNSASEETQNEEQRRMQEELALKQDNAVKLENGEVLILNKTEYSFKDDKIEENIQDAIIEEAVAEVLLKKTFSQEDIDNFNSEEIQDSVRELLGKKLMKSGVIEEKEELDKKFKNFDKKVDKFAKDIIDKEFDIDDNSQELSALDKILINEVIQEKVENKEIQKSTDLSTESVLNAVKEKRAKFIERQSTNSVARDLQNFKETKTTEGAKQTYGEVVEISTERQDAIKAGINEIKRINKPAPPKTEEARREEKKRRIEALDEILKAVAEGEEVIYDSEDDRKYKSTDEIIQELFENTEDKNKAINMIKTIENSIDDIKILNKRGDNNKMKTKNPKYHNAKNIEEKKEAFEKYTDLISDEDKEWLNDNSRKDLSKELYGPVTDITSVLEDMSKNRKI